MPEGHSLRRLALAFDQWFVGSVCEASSPQGRFEGGAARLSGLAMTEANSVGKHLFLRFEGTAGAPLWLHVHLGLYGSWRFYGRPGSSLPPSIGAPRVLDATTGSGPATESSAAALGETAEFAERMASSVGVPPSPLLEDAGGDAFSMIKVASEVGPDSNEGVRLDTNFGAPTSAFGQRWSPPEPRGAVRLRLVTDHAAADLTGPTQCEVLDAGGVEEVLNRLGPDPLDQETDPKLLRAEFVQRVRKSRRPIGELVMDQSVAAGVGNIYRAEGLFREGISPFRRGSNVSAARLSRLWEDFVVMLNRGVTEGRIRTVDPERCSPEVDVLDPNAEKWFVYKRTGQPCLACGTPIRTATMQGRNLFWCSHCQR